jgi:hypothetical protein
MLDDIAVSSTVPDPISASDALASLSATERSAWKETGALPADKFSVIDAASPAAEPDVQAAPAGAETASKPVIVAKKPKNADSRVEELLAERAQLRRELELATKPAPVETKPAASSPAPDAEPTVEQFATYEKFVQAQARWAARQELAAVDTSRRQDAEQSRVQQKQHERASTFSTQLTDARTADPTFMEKVSAEIQGLKPFAALAQGEQATVDNGIAEELIDSPVAPQLMVHLSAHPDDLTRLRACTTPRQLARAIGTLESQYVGKSAPVAALKTIPGAPAPPTTIGTRPAVTADAVESAISRRDQKAYNTAMNARELAAK